MIRLLQILLAVLAVRVVWGVVRALVSRRPGEFRAEPGKAELRGEVVRCERCELHVPEERAVIRDGRTFCSADCGAAATGGS